MPTKQCHVCFKTISQGHHNLQCHNCKFWVHKKCNKLNDIDYKLLQSKSNSSSWFCIVCVDDIFPFSDVSVGANESNISSNIAKIHVG